MPSYNPQQVFNYTNTPFGTQPQAVNMPNPAADLANQLPGLSGLNTGVSGVIGNELSGKLSPDTLAAIRNAGASWGVSNGMPGSTGGTIGSNRTLRDVGLTSMQQQQQGIKDYNSTIPTVSGTQTVAPAIQAEIGTQNSINASAPNPQAAQSYAEGLFNRYLQQLNGGGSTGPVKTDPNAGKNSYVERNNAGGVIRSYNF